MPASDQYRKLHSRRTILILFLGAATFLMIAADMGTGSSGMGLGTMFQAVLAGPYGDLPQCSIVWFIRMPMTLTCLFVGAALSISGLQLQTITGNDLASPYTLGITASASFGAAMSITLGVSVLGYLWIGTALLALTFAFAVSLLMFWLGRRKAMSTSSLILSGIIMNFFFQALQQYLQYKASPEVAQLISGWTFGNLQRSTWISVAVCACTLLAVMPILAKYSWNLTALSTGEERARNMGIPIERLRIQVFLLCSFLIAAAVGFIGTVAFVGLVSPHCAKLLLGDDQRYLLPASALLGGLMMLISSIVSKALSSGAMLPVGIVTSMVGVPFLFLLLLRHGR